ncbi:calponin-3-like isoform X3 [Ptychodera flava]|uniref:calponin-3-like isoform X3 n=1 Tax=Ptychodera flava TaxID=63121 RepID=UPI00396A2DB1
MAYRGRSFGLSAELKAKQRAKYDIEREREARQWIEACTGHPLAEQELGEDHFHKSLKDGIELCRLANILQPGSVKKVNESKMAFKQMENINSFLQAATAYGVPSMSLFQTVDLYEKQNMVSVLDCLWALASMAKKNGFTGPQWGVRVADRNVREFDEETLRAGQAVLPQQAGYTGGATQAGMTAYGTSRHM